MSEERMATARLHEAIQSATQDIEDLGGTVLTGWVLVAEWADLEGSRWISKTACGASGQSLPTWTINGYLHEGLYGDFPSDEEDED